MAASHLRHIKFMALRKPEDRSCSSTRVMTIWELPASGRSLWLGCQGELRAATFRPRDEPCSEYRSDPEATEFPREGLLATAYSSRRSRRCGYVEAVRS